MQGRNKGALPVSGEGPDVPGVYRDRCYRVARSSGAGERVQAGPDQVDGVCAVLRDVGWAVPTDFPRCHYPSAEGRPYNCPSFFKMRFN